uniref:Uncharacterized protein n=1 Tax=Sparus aurata TaxID=8175 RepID=A0A671VGP2_SPAAU
PLTKDHKALLCGPFTPQSISVTQHISKSVSYKKTNVAPTGMHGPAPEECSISVNTPAVSCGMFPGDLEDLPGLVVACCGPKLQVSRKVLGIDVSPATWEPAIAEHFSGAQIKS